VTNLSPFPHGPHEEDRLTIIGGIVMLVLGSMLVAALHLRGMIP